MIWNFGFSSPMMNSYGAFCARKGFMGSIPLSAHAFTISAQVLHHRSSPCYYTCQVSYLTDEAWRMCEDAKHA
jgi:hypothetical protein